MNYPNGSNQKAVKRKRTSTTSYSNRGMTLEEDINSTNEYYLQANIAVIHKKPTPVQIVRVNYPSRSAAIITEAYFKEATTTDYNGLYKNNYIDFEAKETKNKTSFPLNNIHQHQVDHLKLIDEHGGICFLIIRFSEHDETYLFEMEHFLPYWEKQFVGGRKSIPYQAIKDKGHLIPFKYPMRVDYLSVIDELF